MEINADACVAIVNSWANFDMFANGGLLAWQDRHVIPVSVLDGGDWQSKVEQWIVEHGQFAGGTYVTDELDLDVAKVRHWGKIKSQRDQAEWSGFDVPEIGSFDSDPASQAKIIGATVAAQLADAAGRAYEIDWTLKDNSVITLDRQQVEQVGFALMDHLNQVHGKGRQLRQAIESATSQEELDAIVWSFP